MRPAGGHDQTIRNGALALEIDEDNVLRLVVVETGEDQLFQGRNAAVAVLGGFDGRRSLVRTLRGFTNQRGSSFVASLAGA